MKRIKICPVCGAKTDFCPVGHSLCFSCGWNCDLKDCKSKEDRIRRFLERCHWVVEDGDICYIVDIRFMLRKWKRIVSLVYLLILIVT